MKKYLMIVPLIILSGCVSVEEYETLTERLVSYEKTASENSKKYEELKEKHDNATVQLEYNSEILKNYYWKNYELNQLVLIEPWGENWKVVQNSINEFYPTGWYQNTLHLEELTSVVDVPESEGFLLLHPIDENSPAILEFNGLIGKNAKVLNAVVAGSSQGDFLLKITLNEEIIQEEIISGEGWQTLKIDLSKYSNSEVSIKLNICAGGQEEWYFEHCFITDMFFSNGKM